MTIHDVLISRLKDYENNPRNNDLAVEKVKYSIERFGFLFPIIIDMNYVIVAGHTRVRACRELGIQAVPCVIADELTQEQVNLFRLVDNKTSEYSDWDFEKLKSELAQVDLTLDKNQILLERFELTAEVFDIEPEQAEIKIPTLNFIDTDSKSSVSTIHNDNGRIELNDKANLPETIHNDSLGAESVTSSAEGVIHSIAIEDKGKPATPTEVARESKPLLKIYQFRFGDVAFFISKVELDRLNAKYTEYIDTNAVLGCSFAEYLLQGMEKND